jgi:hypothetical protein
MPRRVFTHLVKYYLEHIFEGCSSPGVGSR